MRKLLVLVAVLLSEPAFAGSYTVNTTAAQDARLDRARLKANAASCAQLGLPASCTQAQADTNTPGAVTIYADVQAYIVGTVKAVVQAATGQQNAEDAQAACTAFKGASAASQKASCNAIGQPDTCVICQ